MLKRIFSSVLLIVLLLSVPATALYLKTGDNVIVPKGTIINDNLFVAGSDVDVVGHIKGDLIAFGGDVVINARVDGNIMVGGGNIVISGSARNIYVGGGDVIIAAKTRNDLLAGCGKIYLNKNARIGKDAFVGSGDARIAGNVGRDLRIGSDSMKVMPGAVVAGSITRYSQPDVGKKAAKYVNGFNIAHQILAFLTIFVMGIVIIVFLPNQVKLITSRMTSEFWKSLGWGILSLIVIPFIIILFLITVVGIPLAILLLFAYILAIYIVGIFTSVVIGKWILGKLGKPDISLILALLLGLVILYLVGIVPIIGWIARFILFLWAFGAFISTRFTSYNEAREKGVL